MENTEKTFAIKKIYGESCTCWRTKSNVSIGYSRSAAADEIESESFDLDGDNFSTQDEIMRDVEKFRSGKIDYLGLSFGDYSMSAEVAIVFSPEDLAELIAGYQSETNQDGEKYIYVYADGDKNLKISEKFPAPHNDGIRFMPYKDFLYDVDNIVWSGEVDFTESNEELFKTIKNQLKYNDLFIIN